MNSAEALGEQAIALLRDLVRTACVNNGDPDSGQEIRNADVLSRFFAGSGVIPEIVEPHPGRTSLIVRVRGTETGAPSLALVGHIDVVPVLAADWSVDPFGAEIIDDMLFGRGTLDMLYLTASYAVLTRALAVESQSPDGKRLRGDLIFAAVADEEAGSRLGVEWLLANRPDLVDADYVLTESGGIPVGGEAAIGSETARVVSAVTVTVGEKGLARRTLLVHGVPGHGSAPWGSRNAAVIAAEVIGRITSFAPTAVIGDYWPQYVQALGLSSELGARLVAPNTLLDSLAELGDLAGYAHAATHTTVSPNVLRAGDAINVIPGVASIGLDIRQLPGVSAEEIDRYLLEALGALAEHIEIIDASYSPANVSAMDTALFEVLSEVIGEAYPGARALPIIAAGGSDARFYRARGRCAYGFSMLSASWTYGMFRKLIHSNDERIDLPSVRLTVEALDRVVRRLLG